MKSKLLIIGLVVTVFSCTTEPIIPQGFNGEMPNGDCVPGVISFEQEILPLLVSNCAMRGCHDAITAEDNVVLIDYESIMREVTPYDVNDSELYESMVETGDDIMPPPPASPFSEEKLKLIRDWINQGAKNTTCSTGCDSTVTSTFAAVVYPIVETNCVGCHNATRADGGVRLHTHAEIVTYVNSGSFMGTIEHQTGYPVMPTSGVKLSDCDISLLNQWIANGALND
ncbi:MAG: hypothetical protein AB8G11_20780 [Saprospiraceae bacterium]